MLSWGNQFNICCFLDNHHYNFSHHSVECLLAAGSLHQLAASAGNAFQQLSEFSKKHQDWIFGHFSYDLKNETEELSSSHTDLVAFPDLFFFVPEFLVQLSASEITIGSAGEEHANILEAILSFETSSRQPKSAIDIQSRFSKEEYTQTVRQLQKHILRGDCYEVNFCQEFFAEQAEVEPLHVFRALSAGSPNPFSAYYKLEQKYVCCFSPERYLRKEGNDLLSQPIKGTAERDKDPAKDAANKKALEHSEKERAENIMIVDLVRNDLSRICKKGTVKVDELCKVYSFPQVHQMISTISGELPEAIDWTETVSSSFPMGSMTGAPKKRVMELIETYERSRRGLFSGSIGYRSPNGDFDLNVVIRSVLYNAQNQYLSFHTGSAITFKSDPAEEYDECLLKAAAIKKVLAETNTFH